jgi:hypothetical protein
MTQQVKVKVKVGQVVRFPGVCVHCANPAGEGMTLRKRIGRLTRLVDVPVCVDCAQTLRRRSGEEERRQRIGYAATGLAFLLAAAVVYALLPPLAVLLRGGAAVILGVLVASAVQAQLRGLALKAARPEKRMILESARLANFSWRATTFEFSNEAFVERFVDLNEQLVMRDK